MAAAKHQSKEKKQSGSGMGNRGVTRPYMHHKSNRNHSKEHEHSGGMDRMMIIKWDT